LSDPGFGQEFDIMVDTIVDEYLEDELSPHDRKQAETYFFKSERRREKLAFAAALKRRKTELLRKREWWKTRTPYLRAAAIVFVAVSLGAITFKTFFGKTTLKEGLNALHTAYRNERPLNSRISGFSYAPAPGLRGAIRNVDSVQKDLAGNIILANDAADPGSEVQQALGQYYLTENRFDEAIDHLQRSLISEPNNPRVHSDLGSAFLERGKLRRQQMESGEETVDFANSLIHLNKALQLDSNNLEALFNRALLYGEMGLSPQAEKDWRQYIEKDSTSKWAGEARDKLNEIEKRRTESSSNVDQPFQVFLDAYQRGDEATAWNVLRRQYSSAGNTITNTLVDSYLDFDRKGDNSAAESKLEALSFVAKLEQQTAGDHYTADLVSSYKRSNAQQRRELAHAREQMSKAYDLFLGSDVNEALTYYSRAEQIFRQNGNESEATLATYRIGHCYLHNPDLKKSEQIFTELRNVSERKKYRWLFNQSIYRTASIRFTYNDYSESVDYAQQALKQSEQMGDFVGTLNALLVLAEQYRLLNDQQQSWPYLHRAVTMTADSGAEPLQKWGVITGIAFNLSALKLYEAAVEYQREALRLAKELKPERPLILSRAYDYLALTQAHLKNYDAALNNINLAFESGRQLENQNSGREMMGTTSLHAGDIFREAGQYENALASYDRSIQLYEQLNYPFFTYPARKGRLLSYLAKRNHVAAEAELDLVLKIFDKYRASLKRESQRQTYFNVEQSVYDLAMDFAWSRKGDYERAFKYCELSRGRSLLDAIRKSLVDEPVDDNIERLLSENHDPLSVDDIKKQTPEDAQIVQYAVLEEKLLIWVVSGNKITTREKLIKSSELGDKVRRFVEAINKFPNSPEPAFIGDARELYKILIAPIESLLDGKKLTCIVPDKVLHYLPFGALVSEAGDEYLVKKFRIQLAPSSSIFLEGIRDDGQNSAHAEERLLSVGNPTFNRSDFPKLKPLPEAHSEVLAIAGLYKGSDSPLLERSATEKAVRSGIQAANVAHFALHYVVDERHSLYSKMVLTPPSKITDEADDGLLQIHEIYKMDLAHMRLVVLAACQTAIEQQYGGEGAVSVARPFLASRVPLVVASLWPVESSSTERLMSHFHRHRKDDNLPTAEALQRAQLDMIEGENQHVRHPYYWAAFTVIGRYAKF
jgi:CHAT domain-containing protein